MKNKSFLMMAALSALSLQAQAVSFTLSDLSVTSSLDGAGVALPLTFSQVTTGTAEPARPDLVSESAHLISTVVDVAPTTTTTGTSTTTTMFDRTTTSYSAGSAATTTFQAVVSPSSITTAVQRVRLFGTITSNLDVAQTLTFELIANGSFESYSDDGDTATPGAPALLYKYSSSAFTNFVGSLSPDISYQKPGESLYHERTSAILQLSLMPHEVKYFATKISTNGYSSISDYLIDFSGATVDGQGGTPRIDHVVENYDTIIASTVPEPESYALLLAGLSVMGFVGYRKKRLEV